MNSRLNTHNHSADKITRGTLTLQKDQNGIYAVSVRNDTDDTGAGAGFYSNYAGTNKLYGLVLSPSFTTDGMLTGNTAVLYSNGNSSGLKILTYDATTLSFGTNNAQRMTIGSTGLSTFTTGTITNSDVVALTCTSNFATTTSQADNYTGIYMYNTSYYVDTGITNSGYLVSYLTGNLLGANHLGTLAQNVSFFAQSGMGATTGTITDNYGYRSTIWSGVGSTITNSYMYHGSMGTTNGTITNNWGIYLSGEDKNYFSGNVGIGNNTLETWKSTLSVLQVGGLGSINAVTAQSASSNIAIGCNCYLDQTDNRYEYIIADEASLYGQINGTHEFYSAVVGTADGAITWSNSFKILGDTGAFELYQNGIAHGITTLFDTDQYSYLGRLSATNGGTSFYGISNADSAKGLDLVGIIGGTSPSVETIRIRGYKSNGTTGIASIATTEKLLTICNGADNRFLIYGNGNTWINGDMDAVTYSVNGTAGASFSGSPSSITVVNGIVTAAS